MVDHLPLFNRLALKMVRPRILLIASLAVNALFLLFLLKSLISQHSKSVPQESVDSRLFPHKILHSPPNGYCNDLDMLVVVHTRLNSFARRDFWRRTYGSSKLSRKFKYKLMFPMGTSTATGRNRHLEEELEREAKWHGDIQQSDYGEDYHNITIKQLSHLRYFANNCKPYTVLMKVDDDLAWVVDKTHKFAMDLQDRKNATIRCLVWKGMRIFRDNSSKWYVSEKEMNGTRYPPYCSGMAYFAQWQAVKKMVDTAPKMKYFWIDDVFITGLLAGKAGVTLEDHAKLYTAHWNLTRLEKHEVLFNVYDRAKSQIMFDAANKHLMKEDKNPKDY